jgi:hypothetical protein
MRNAYKVFVGKSEGKIALRNPKERSDGDVRIVV